MIVKAFWLLVLGILGIAGPFVLRAQAKWPRWVVYAAQVLLGLNAALWGLWGLIESMTMVSVVGHAPIFWTSNFVAAVLELALPALFAVNILGSLLAKRADAQPSKSRRRVAVAQIVVGVVAIAVAATMIALESGAAAP